MGGVLIVDADRQSASALVREVSAIARRVVTLDAGRDAMTACQLWRPHVAIVDASLRDMSGIDLLRKLRAVSPRTAVVMTSAQPSTRCAVDAIRAGAVDYLEKPIDGAEVRRLVASLVSVAPAGGDEPAAHAAARWVSLVMPVLDSPSDLKTLRHWARWVAVSPGAIRNWCRTAKLPTKRSLSFARMLRVIVQHREGSRPEHMLDIVDVRTLNAFLKLGSSTAAPCRLPMDPGEFLERQEWITDATALRELTAALRLRQTALDSVGRDESALAS